MLEMVEFAEICRREVVHQIDFSWTGLVAIWAALSDVKTTEPWRTPAVSRKAWHWIVAMLTLSEAEMMRRPQTEGRSRAGLVSVRVAPSQEVGVLTFSNGANGVECNVELLKRSVLGVETFCCFEPDGCCVCGGQKSSGGGKSSLHRDDV
jgi:hypothetical protein